MTLPRKHEMEYTENELIGLAITCWIAQRSFIIECENEGVHNFPFWEAEAVWVEFFGSYLPRRSEK